MIGLGATRENVSDVESGREVAELREHPAGVGLERDGQRVRADEDLRPAIAVAVFARPGDRGGGARLDQRSLGLQERRLHRAAEVRKVTAAEHAVPVGVVGLSAPERDLTAHESRVVGPPGERGVDRPREAHHLPVRVGDFGILDEEIPPETAAQQARQPLAVGESGDLRLGRLERARGRDRQRPLPHLTVGRGRQVDSPARRKAIDDISERRQLKPARGQESVEEAIEPAPLVHVGVRARPDPELLAVVDHGDRRRVSPARLQIRERLVDVGERDQVPQPLVDRKDPEALALLVRQVVAAQIVDLEASQGEVSVVDEHVRDASLAQHPWQVRLPHALGQPHPAGSHPEVRLEERCEPLDLADLVVVGQHGEDRLVEPAGQELHLPACGDDAQEVEGAG